MKKAAAALIFCVSALLVFSGCSIDAELKELIDASVVPAAETQAEDETYQIEYDSEFGILYDTSDSLCPLLCSSQANLEIGLLTHSRLVTLDDSGKPQGGIAVSWSRYWRVWTIEIGDAFFADGTPVTAADAAYSILLARDESPIYASRLENVTSVKSDGQTLTISTARQDSGLIARLNIPVIKSGCRDGSSGGGRYILNGDTLTAAGDAGIGTIYLVAAENDEASRLFGTGDIDSLSYVPLSQATECSGALETVSVGTAEMYMLSFNVKRSPLNNAGVRRALSASIDRDALCGDVLDGYAVPATMPVPSWSYIYHSSLAGVSSFDTEDIPAGTYMEITVCEDSSYKVAAAESIARDWNGAGMDVHVDTLKWEDYLDALETGDFDVALIDTQLPEDFSVEAILKSRGKLNYGKYSSSKMDAALKALTGDDTRDSYEWLGIFNDDSPVAVLCFLDRVDCVRAGDITGFNTGRFDVFADILSWRKAGQAG